MLPFLSVVPCWCCLWWLTQLHHPAWYHCLQHLNREISIPGGAEGIQRRIWRTGFTVLPTPYPTWAAAHRSMNCKVLSGPCERLALPVSLLWLSRGNLLTWVHSGPMTTEGEISQINEADKAPTKQRTQVLWEWTSAGWASALSAGQHISSSEGGLFAQPLVCFALTGVSYWDGGYEKLSFCTLVMFLLISHETTSQNFGCISLSCTTVVAHVKFSRNT